MSKERQKARAAREAARALEVAAAAKAREKQANRKAIVLPRRRRRYGQLPTSEIVRLVVVFVALQVLIWFFLPGLPVRFSLGVLSAACLLVYVNTRSTRRSTTR